MTIDKYFNSIINIIGFYFIDNILIMLSQNINNFITGKILGTINNLHDCFDNLTLTHVQSLALHNAK